MIKKYYDQDCNLSMLDGKTVAIIGFGSQGHAHAMNLNESGALLFENLQKGADEDKLVNALLDEYDVDEATARADVKRFISKVKDANILE